VRVTQHRQSLSTAAWPSTIQACSMKWTELDSLSANFYTPPALLMVAVDYSDSDICAVKLPSYRTPTWKIKHFRHECNVFSPGFLNNVQRWWSHSVHNVQTDSTTGRHLITTWGTEHLTIYLLLVKDVNVSLGYPRLCTTCVFDFISADISAISVDCKIDEDLYFPPAKCALLPLQRYCWWLLLQSYTASALPRILNVVAPGDYSYCGCEISSMCVRL
jgi:hypothetical protein